MKKIIIDNVVFEVSNAEAELIFEGLEIAARLCAENYSGLIKAGLPRETCAALWQKHCELSNIKIQLQNLKNEQQ